MDSFTGGKARLPLVGYLIVILLLGFCAYIAFPDVRVWITEHLTGRSVMR